MIAGGGAMTLRPTMALAAYTVGAEIAAALGIWLVALRCRFDAYDEVLRRLTERRRRPS
jgi:hypothetical protein